MSPGAVLIIPVYSNGAIVSQAVCRRIVTEPVNERDAFAAILRERGARVTSIQEIPPRRRGDDRRCRRSIHHRPL